MFVRRRMGLLLSGTLLGVSFAAAAPALADDAQNQLQNQINDLQRQLQTLQDEMAVTQKTAQEAEQAAQKVPRGVYDAASAGTRPMPTKGPSWLPQNIKVSLAGSFIEAATAWRQHNEISSGASDPPFSSLPFANSPLYYENEWRASAQQSRLAVRASGDVSPAQHLQAYYEQDFLGAGVTANSRESNSYNLRVRQAWLGYDNDDWHFHMMAGQGWSLLTQDRVGIQPLFENVPLTIDAQYAVGFNWARQEQLRFVWDWNKVAWFGVSAEAPQASFVSNGIGAVGGPSQPGGTSVAGSPIPPGLGVNAFNACNASGLLNSTTACSDDIAPDFIEKFALDPGWGHYEVLALERWFADEVSVLAVPNSWTTKVNFGWGVGGSFLVPAVPKFLDLQGSVLYGAGTGRYGSSQLPDVFIGPDGSATPLRTLQVLLGAVAHPWNGLDVYVYAGQEEVAANFWTIGGVQGGYGNPAYADGGCAIENLASGVAGFNDPIAGTGCVANVQRVQELTVGFWQNIYKGDLGRFVFGAQYEFVKLTAFPGSPTAAGLPNVGLSPYNNIVYTSIRYYPF